MAKMGRYCSGFLVSDLRKFPGFQPNLAGLRPADGGAAERRDLADDDVLFLHEDLVVTDGHWRDQNVVFESADEAWRTFCSAELGFAVLPEVAAIGT